MKKISTRADSVSVTSSSDIETWYCQGEELANEEHYQEALIYIDQVLNAQPSYGAAWVLKAVVLIHLEHYQEALNCCNEALNLQPDNQEAWLFRGVVFHRLSHYREAYASYDKALGVCRQPLWRQIQTHVDKLFHR